MRILNLVTTLAGGLILAGCARWEPSRQPGPVAFDRACPLRRAPRVETFGEAGVRAIYHFAVRRGADAQLGAFIHAADSTGFNVIPIMVEMNGTDTLIVQGRAVLREQRAVDSEFRAACGLGGGRIFRAHVRHNPVGQAGPVRVR